MKIWKISVMLVVGLLVFSCGTAKKTVVSNATLDSMMEQETFMIEVKAAEPQVTNALAQIGASGVLQPGNTISRIDVAGEGYFIKLKGDQVTTNLPYYGERQMGGGYGSDSGIKLKGTAKDLTIVKNEEKKSYVVTFGVDNASESYFFTIDMSASLNGLARVRSSHRNRIRFTGKIKELTSDD